MSRREDTYAIVDISQDWIKAGLGVNEVIARPKLEFRTRCGLRRPLASNRNAADYLVGAALDEALKSEENIEIVYPLSVGDESQQVASSDRSRTLAPMTNGPATTLMDVDESNPTLTRRQRKTEGVADWLALEALLRHALFVGLGLPARPLSHHVLFSIPPCWPVAVHEQLMQLFFEQLHLSAVMMVDRAVAQTYACNQISALVIDLMEHSVEISVVHNNIIAQQSKLRSHVGSMDLDRYLAHLLLQHNSQLPSLLSISDPEKLQAALLKIVKWLKDNDCIHFRSSLLDLNMDEEEGEEADAEEGQDAMADVAKALVAGNVKKVLMEKNNQKQASNSAAPQADPGKSASVNVPHPTQSSLLPIPIGPERHRWAEPLFDPALLSNVRLPYAPIEMERKMANLTDVASESLRSLSQSRTSTSQARDTSNANGAESLPWENVVVTGQSSLVKGVASAIVQRLSDSIADNEPHQSLEQRRFPRHVSIPDYFSEMKDRPDLAAYLGGCIMAKLGFADASGKQFYTKVDYTEFGPSMIRLAGDPE